MPRINARVPCPRIDPIVIATTLWAILLIAGAAVSQAGELLPVPDRLIVLTFDDGNKSDVEFVAPLLKRCGFGATFFVSDCDWFREDKKTYMTWEEVRKLHAMGFEVGKYTVIAMRDLAKYVDPAKGPSDPLAPISCESAPSHLPPHSGGASSRVDGFVEESGRLGNRGRGLFLWCGVWLRGHGALQ